MNGQTNTGFFTEIDLLELFVTGPPSAGSLVSGDLGRQFPPPLVDRGLEINELYRKPLPPPKPCTRLETLRRFPPPWTVEELTPCFVVIDSAGQKLAYVYYEEEVGPRSAAKLLSKDEARRIAVNIPSCRG